MLMACPYPLRDGAPRTFAGASVSGVRPRADYLAIDRAGSALALPVDQVESFGEIDRLGRLVSIHGSALHVALADRRATPVIDVRTLTWATSAAAFRFAVVVRGRRRSFALLADGIEGLFQDGIVPRFDIGALDRVGTCARRHPALVLYLDSPVRDGSDGKAR